MAQRKSLAATGLQALWIFVLWWGVAYVIDRTIDGWRSPELSAFGAWLAFALLMLTLLGAVYLNFGGDRRLSRRGNLVANAILPFFSLYVYVVGVATLARLAVLIIFTSRSNWRPVLDELLTRRRMCGH